jgi:hypothetical protein
MLLDNEARRRWWWKEEEYLFEDDRKVIGHIEEVLRNLGFDVKEFLYQKVEYYVIVSR